MTTASRKPAQYRPTIADKAEMLLVNSAAWAHYRDDAGKIVGYGVPSMSTPNKFYRVNLDGCDCQAGRRNEPCSHRAAVCQYVEMRRAEQAAPVTPIRPPKVLPGERIARSAQLAKWSAEMWPDDAA